MTPNSLPKMYINPTRMKPSAMSAVELSLAKSRTRASGKKTINCTRMKYLTGISAAQFVIPETKLWSEGRLVSEWMDIKLLDLLGDSAQRKSCRQLRSPVEILQLTPEWDSASMIRTKFHQCLINDCHSNVIYRRNKLRTPKTPWNNKFGFYQQQEWIQRDSGDKNKGDSWE